MDSQVIETLEFESIFAVLKTLADQIGVEKKDFTNKYEIVKAIYEKYEDGEAAFSTNDIYGLVKNICKLVDDDKIYPSVKLNNLTYNGSIWKFERMPESGEYVAGDLYVNSNKVGTYNGYTCRNTISGWEEAALAIESESFGNQAISLIREDDGEWELK